VTGPGIERIAPHLVSLAVYSVYRTRRFEQSIVNICKIL